MALCNSLINQISIHNLIFPSSNNIIKTKHLHQIEALINLMRLKNASFRFFFKNLFFKAFLSLKYPYFQIEHLMLPFFKLVQFKHQ